MIVRLYTYFGLVGLLSIAVWLGALGALAYAACRRRASLWGLRALGLALAGLLLAYWNSAQVSRIEVDRTEELNAARARQLHERQAEQDALKRRAAQVRYVEDAKTDPLDLAGIEDGSKKSVYERAAEESEAAYLYKQTGKQQRDPGRRGAATNAPDMSEMVDEAADEAAAHSARVMPHADVIRANRLDRFNLWLARLTLIAVLHWLGWDYVRRFNKTFETVLPLPLAGPWIDGLFPKTRAVLWRNAAPEQVRAYLETVVRKGEAFIDLGAAFPLDTPRLTRWHLPGRAIGSALQTAFWPWGGRLAIRLPRRSGPSPKLRALGEQVAALCAGSERLARRLPACCVRSATAAADACRTAWAAWRDRWTVPLHAYAREQAPFSHDFVFESAWFGRSCFTIADHEQARALLDALIGFLDARFRPRATARRTVHLLWRFDAPPPPALLRALIALAHEANFKLLLTSSHPLPSESLALIEEQTP